MIYSFTNELLSCERRLLWQTNKKQNVMGSDFSCQKLTYLYMTNKGINYFLDEINYYL